MTKTEVVWLIVRLIGVCSLFNSLRLIFIILENLLMATNADVGKTVLSQGSGLIIGWVIEAVVYFIIGVYLLLKGNNLFYLLNSESD